MTPRPGFQHLVDQLQAYKKKFYLNQLLRGSLWTALFLLGAYLIFSGLEYGLRFSSPIRGALFFVFMGLALWLLGRYVLLPLIRLIDNRRQLSSEAAAQQIGHYFPEVGDKLLNTLQLSALTTEDNALLQASIEQRSQELGIFRFTEAVPLGENRRYAGYLSVPLAILILLWLFYPQLLRDGSGRIIHYQQEFVPVAPFQFQVQNTTLTAFRNEDYTLSLALTGNALPEAVYLQANGRRLRMSAAGVGKFEHTFPKIQQNLTFQFEAAGYQSHTYTVEVVNRPNLKNFNVRLDYPGYLGKPAERLSNIGNLQVPQGTRVTWQFNTLDADSLALYFQKADTTYLLQSTDDQNFSFQNRIMESDEYRINLYNQYSANREEIRYTLDVIPDEYPKIDLDQLQDTTLYEYIILGGNIADDYGLTRLRLRYRVTEAGETPVDQYHAIELGLNRDQISQSYYHRWTVDSFGLKEGDKLEYYLQVYDNDGVRGPKASRTPQYAFALPSRKEISETLDRVAEQTQSQLDRTLEQAQELREKLEETEERLRGKNNLDWRDQNQMQQMLEQRQQLEQSLQELQKQMRDNMQQQETFNEPNPQLQEKMESLQELLNEVLDPETKKLWDELQRLLQEQADKQEIQEMVENLNQSEKNMEQELDRALELFKRLQAEMKLEEGLDMLNKLMEEQEALAEDTENAENGENEGENGDNEGENSEDGAENDSDSENAEGNQQNEGENSDAENQEGSESDAEQSDAENDAQEGQQNQESGQNEQQSPKTDEQLAQEQEQLREDFKELQETLDEYRKMNQDLKRPNSLQDTFDEEQNIEQQQQQSQEQLEQGERQKSQQSQQNATQQMQQMQQKLQQMQGGMTMESMQEDIDNLRDIVDNLVKLSFNQEALMKEFREVQLRDPRIVELSQQQLKLADDAQIVEDSLLALANRVFQIKSFVTRELNSMNGHMDRTVEELRARNFNQAMSEQQFTMTSMNNLALLLDDVLSQMQQQMASSMGTGQGSQQQQQNNMSMGELQQQLNNQIQQLQQSGKSGRQLSEELARMAAEQERLRKALQKMEEMMEGQPGGPELGGELDEIQRQMEQTEIDLVNKRLTRELLERQQQIATRLLEAEKAMREQDLDEEREGQQANEYDRMIPEAFEEYIRAKEKEIELLKSVPLQLNPYYKKEVSDYFKRLNDN